MGEHVNVRIPRDLRKQLIAAAESNGLSISSFVATALREAIDRQEAQAALVTDNPHAWITYSINTAMRGGGGFKALGEKIAKNLILLRPSSVTVKEWRAEVQQLLTQATDYVNEVGAAEFVGGWLGQNLPQVYASIPKTKIPLFATGVLNYAVMWVIRDS